MKRAVLNNNAKQIVIDDIKFRSEYEAKVYEHLKSLGLPFKYEPEKIILTPSFQMENIKLFSPSFDSKGHKKGFGEIDSIRAWTYTPDFEYVDTESKTTYIIECKGQITKDFEQKWKRFLHVLSNDKSWNYEVFLIQRIGEMKKVGEYLKTKITR